MRDDPPSVAAQLLDLHPPVSPCDLCEELERPVFADEPPRPPRLFKTDHPPAGGPHVPLGGAEERAVLTLLEDALARAPAEEAGRETVQTIVDHLRERA